MLWQHPKPILYSYTDVSPKTQDDTNLSDNISIILLCNKYVALEFEKSLNIVF